ncbi:MAG TPA: phenylalanine--tRNA ligase subunit beta [Candidatus Nanoarchaeia archaeon]|nr:phenylalanine--tRNA ligase subunit beta [Candidatus Nanoarchaeia archaeon]
MPSITLNKKVFEQLVGKELPLEELKDRISMLGTDLEDIKDNEIYVEVFPNRPDMLSEPGFARAFSSFINVKTGLRKYVIKESNNKVIVDASVKGIRPYTACAIVKGLHFDEERLQQIIQIQEKLHVTYGRNRKKCAIGIYPMEKITFPITYKAETPAKIKFKPLEAHREMTAAEILEEHKAGKEYAHLLQGLAKYPIFIDAKGEILSMPPVINSDKTGRVTEDTKDVFIECSGFDFDVLSTCLNMIVTALADVGGEIYSIRLEYPDGIKTTPQLTPTKMKLDLLYVNKRLGLSLSEKDAGKLLEKMGYGFEQGQVLVPAYRADILHQVDFVEDIAIAYGYENFQEEIPNVATIGEEDAFEKFAKKVRELLVGMQLLEVKNFHLTTKEDLSTKMNLTIEPIPLKNAIGDHNHLRNAIMPSLMKTLAENQHHEYPQNIFEIGRIFVPWDTETGVLEPEHLNVMLCHDKTDFTEIRQVLEALIHALGLECAVKESDHPPFIPGRSGDITIHGKKMGVIGELHPQVIANWQLTMPIVCFELNLGILFELAWKK